MSSLHFPSPNEARSRQLELRAKALSPMDPAPKPVGPTLSLPDGRRAGGIAIAGCARLIARRGSPRRGEPIGEG